MFFDNSKYFSFIDKCREFGIELPVIPGIKPLTKRNQIALLPKIFNIKIPDALSREVEKASTDEAVKQIGIEWCIQQCRELRAKGVPVIHFYTMGFADTTRAIAKAVY